MLLRESCLPAQMLILFCRGHISVWTCLIGSALGTLMITTDSMPCLVQRTDLYLLLYTTKVQMSLFLLVMLRFCSFLNQNETLGKAQ